jgi:hypothetical protein
MELYRCLLLDAAAAVFGYAEFHAIDDDEAGERAAVHMRTHAAAHGYSLWQSGRLVAEQHADKRAA